MNKLYLYSNIRFRMCELRLLAICPTLFICAMSTWCHICCCLFTTIMLLLIVSCLALCLDTSTHSFTSHTHAACKSDRDRQNVITRCCTASAQTVKYLILPSPFSSLCCCCSIFVSKSNVSLSSHIIVYSTPQL